MKKEPPRFEDEFPEAAKMLMELYAENERKQRYVGAGRNQKCPCGSGKKYKKCCLK